MRRRNVWQVTKKPNLFVLGDFAEHINIYITDVAKLNLGHKM